MQILQNEAKSSTEVVVTSMLNAFFRMWALLIIQIVTRAKVNER